MIVYSLPQLVVFRQVLRRSRRETILTNKPLFLLFFLKHWPLEGLYFPDVCTEAGFQRGERLISDGMLPRSRRWMTCNPNAHPPFLGEAPALPSRSCHRTVHVQGPVRLSVNMNSRFLELFYSQGFQDAHFGYPPALSFQTQVQPPFPRFHQDSPRPRLCRRQWGIVGLLPL